METTVVKTVKDNALIILKNIEDNKIDAESLSIDMRRVCVDYLDKEGANPEQMAKKLKVCMATIYTDLHAIEDGYNAMITMVDYRAVLSGM